MKLVIVESPTKAKTINKYLGAEYKVIASFGHIRDLPSKNGSVLPQEDFAMKYEVTSKSSAHVKAIIEAAKQAEIIYLATDPDREGESISWHIIEVIKEKKALKKGVDIKRVAFNEITKKTVLQAIIDARDVDQNLVNAQQARRALDYLVGFTLSPVLWRKLPGSRSAGRVQSVALRLICDREHEIEKFVTREYWSIVAKMLGESKQLFKASLVRIAEEKLDKFAIANIKQAEDLVAELKEQQYLITNIEKKQQRRNPPAPFTTSSLQQEASRKLGFGAKKTMQLAQKLYEGIEINGETTALITYMRTDGVSLSIEAVNATRSWINSNLGKEYLPEKARIYKAKTKNAQEAHEAIRPVDVTLTPEKVKNSLEIGLYKLYELIWKRTIACQMENVVIDMVVATIDSHNQKFGFRAVGSVISFDGFYKIYKEDVDDSEANDEDKLLPKLTEGEQITAKEITPNQHFTEPPPRFTEASLIKKLEELGIGRPSTYTSIISVLQDRNYVILDKKRFIPESRGLLVTAFLVNLFSKYVEYDFTAQLENQLDDVAEGKMDWKLLLNQFWQGFSANVDGVSGYKITDVINQLEEVLADHLFPPQKDGSDARKCPACANGQMGLKLGKFGAFLACSNYPECNFTKKITQNEEGTIEGETSSPEEQNRILGQDELGNDISLKKGPYGLYVQVNSVNTTDAKPKRASIPTHYKPEAVTLELALNLLQLPKKLGVNTSGEEISIAIGKFGPYVKSGKIFASIPRTVDMFSLTLEQAIAIVDAKLAKPAKEPKTSK